jgi:hypothetical protein
MSETIEEQRKVEGFGDPQYTCSTQELAVRRSVYIFFQQLVAAGAVQTKMTQDWQGNTLHIQGSFRPADLARMIMENVNAASQTTRTEHPGAPREDDGAGSSPWGS